MSTHSSNVAEKKHEIGFLNLSGPAQPDKLRDTVTLKIATEVLTNSTRGKKKTMPTASDITLKVSEGSPSPPTSPSPSPSKSKSKSPKGRSEQDNPSYLTRMRSMSNSDNERGKRDYELMPQNFELRNFINPELRKMQLKNIHDFEMHSSHFVTASREVFSTNKLVTDAQNEEIRKLHGDVVYSANTVAKFLQSGQLGESKNFRKEMTVDFLHDLKQILRQCFFSRKVEPLVKRANDELKDILIINFKNCRHDNRIKLFFHDLDLGIEKKKISELEKKQKEIKILHHYRDVMLDLAQNLERIGNTYVLKEEDELPLAQRKFLEPVEIVLNRFSQGLQKYDKKEIELKRILSRDSYDSYKSIMYNSIAKAIKTQVIEIFWITANKDALIRLIQLRSEELKNANKRHALFCSDCLEAFDSSLNSQKYDVEFLLGWRRMAASASVIYIDGERRPLVEPRRIPEPDDPDDPEKMRQYFEQLDNYGKATMACLSKHAFFGDEKFLEDFFKVAVELSEEVVSEVPPSTDPLEIQARVFSFLETLLEPSHDNNKILTIFNRRLLEEHEITIGRLEQKAQANFQSSRLSRSGAEMAIEFMLRFYRSLNHKYIMEPISNLEEKYKLAYSTQESIIKKDIQILSRAEGTEVEVLQPARCIYIVLGNANFEVHSVRVDEIDPGPDIDETYCFIYTYTSVREPYPAELEWLDSESNSQFIKHSIEFSYQLIKPKALRSSQESQAIESAILEKVRRLGLLIDAAGFPNFAERFAKSGTENIAHHL